MTDETNAAETGETRDPAPGGSPAPTSPPAGADDAVTAPPPETGDTEAAPSVDEMIGEFEGISPDSAAALRREWGGDYHANMAHAFAGVEAVSTPELHDALDRAGLINNPAIIRAAAQYARAMGLVPGSAPAADASATPAHRAPGATEARQAEDRLAKLRALPDYWDNDAVQRETRRLYLKLYGPGPIIGNDDRTL